MHCGGVLHRADYARKVRCVKVEARRLSLCCAQESCRRRKMPGSVRFLGRKVYPGVIAFTVDSFLDRGPRLSLPPLNPNAEVGVRFSGGKRR